MPIIIALGILYLFWRMTRKSRHSGMQERVRILEARVRLLEEQLDQDSPRSLWLRQLPENRR